VLVLAACGTATPAVPTSSTPDLSKVTLTIGSPCKTCLGRLLIASGQDKNTQYTLKYADFDSTPPLIEALNADHVDVATGGETGVLFGMANGAQIKMLGATDEKNTGGSLILVKNNSDLRKVADLKGRPVRNVMQSTHLLTLVERQRELAHRPVRPVTRDAGLRTISIGCTCQRDPTTRCELWLSSPRPVGGP
jgi:ABC-type nitrate/sulfonate/bicarbonate transport system substrate-binding protein